ncbi:hypothetical protein ACET94_21120 [Aeromonas veronii]
MAFNSPILAVKSQVFGVMGISNADKEFVMKVRSTCLHLPQSIDFATVNQLKTEKQQITTAFLKQALCS